MRYSQKLLSGLIRMTSLTLSLQQNINSLSHFSSSSSHNIVSRWYFEYWQYPVKGNKVEKRVGKKMRREEENELSSSFFGMMLSRLQSVFFVFRSLLLILHWVQHPNANEYPDDSKVQKNIKRETVGNAVDWFSSSSFLFFLSVKEHTALSASIPFHFLFIIIFASISESSPHSSKYTRLSSLLKAGAEIIIFIPIPDVFRDATSIMTEMGIDFRSCTFTSKLKVFLILTSWRIRWSCSSWSHLDSLTLSHDVAISCSIS